MKDNRAVGYTNEGFNMTIKNMKQSLETPEQRNARVKSNWASMRLRGRG